MCLTCKANIGDIVDDLLNFDQIGTSLIDAVMLTSWACAGDGKPTSEPFRSKKNKQGIQNSWCNLLFHNCLQGTRRVESRTSGVNGLVEFSGSTTGQEFTKELEMDEEVKFAYALKDCPLHVVPMRKREVSTGKEQIHIKYSYEALDKDGLPPVDGQNQANFEVLLSGG